MKRRRKKGKRWEIGEEEKGMERVCSEGKRKGRMRCEKKKMKKKEKEKEKRKKKKNRKWRRQYMKGAASPKIFPSTKLGNNMTPIKGRLGKNTTPTIKNPVKLNRNLQTNSQ